MRETGKPTHNLRKTHWIDTKSEASFAENVQPKTDLHLQLGLEEVRSFVQKTLLQCTGYEKAVVDVVTIFAWTLAFNIFLFFFSLNKNLKMI